MEIGKPLTEIQGNPALNMATSAPKAEIIWTMTKPDSIAPETCDSTV